MNGHPAAAAGSHGERPASSSGSAQGAQAPGLSLDVLSILRLVFRHWRVTVPAMVLTMLGVIAAATLSPPLYESSGSVALLNPPEPPPETGDPSVTASTVNTDNPYARFGDLSVVADIVARIMSGETMAEELESRGVIQYAVATNTNFSRGPIIQVTAQDSTAAASVRAARTVLAEVATVLEDRQIATGVDPRYFITVEAVETPATADALYGSTVRSAIGVLAVGGLFTLACAVLADALSRRRAARRAARPTAPSRPERGSVKEQPARNGSARSSQPVPSSRPAVLRLSPTKAPTRAPSTTGDVRTDG